MTKRDTKVNGKSPVLAPIFQMSPDWFDSFGPNGLWRSLGVDSIKIEQFRDDGCFVVRAELPGIDPDKDVDVTVDDDMLRIKMERTERTEDREKDHYRSEFRYGAVSRVVQLPAGSSTDDVKASYHDGILEVRVAVDDAKAGIRKVAIAH